MTQIPFIDLAAQQARIRDAVDAGIARVLDHGRYIMGPEVAEAETRLAEFSGATHCVTVSSGTDALLAPLMAMGIGAGDAVFVPTFTFTASAEVIVLLGASPVFVDVDPDSFNISVADLKHQIAKVRAEGTLNPRLVMAVDLFGLPADYDALAALCSEEGIELLADAAQSYGGQSGNRRVGSLAPVTATSFFPAKPLGCYGDGGAVLTDDGDLAAALESIRQHGKGVDKYDNDRIGLNARFDTIQAAVILAKLDIFAEEIDLRQAVARRYNAGLAGIVETPAVPDGLVSAWAQYTIKTDRREALADGLKAQGIPTAIYYPKPMHLQPAYARFGDGPGSQPVSEKLCDTVISLPMHPYLDAKTQDRICATIRDILG